MTKQQFLEMKLEDINSYCKRNNKNNIKRYLKDLLDGLDYKLVTYDDGLAIEDNDYNTIIDIRKDKDYWGSTIYYLRKNNRNHKTISDSVKYVERTKIAHIKDKYFGDIWLSHFYNYQPQSNLHTTRFEQTKTRLENNRWNKQYYQNQIKYEQEKIEKAKKQIEYYQEQLKKLGVE